MSRTHRPHDEAVIELLKDDPAGLQRESLYRALSPRGNPTLKTLLAVLSGAGLRLSVEKSHQEPAAA